MQFKVTAGVFVINGARLPTGAEFFSATDWTQHAGNVQKISDASGPEPAPRGGRVGRAIPPHLAARRAEHLSQQVKPEAPTTLLPAGVPDTGAVEMAPPPQEKAKPAAPPPPKK